MILKVHQNSPKVDRHFSALWGSYILGRLFLLMTRQGHGCSSRRKGCEGPSEDSRPTPRSAVTVLPVVLCDLERSFQRERRESVLASMDW